MIFTKFGKLKLIETMKFNSNHFPLLRYVSSIVIALTFSFVTTAQTIRCYTDEMELIRQQADPNAENAEVFEQWMTEQVQFQQMALNVGGLYQIPVVVHIIHNGEALGVGRNISFAAVQSQIDVLNEDFRKLLGSNGWNNNPVGADTEIEFCLAQRRPDGSAFPNGEPGVNRINRNTVGWTAPPHTTNYINSTIKPYTFNNNVPTATRGWNPDNYFNIWVCEISGGILGYAQFPQTALGGMGCGAQSAATDGCVLTYNSVGKSSVTGFAGPYNEGRTATHEIGHWLGLRHIWGDGNCAVDDFCNDTPLAAAANYGCPVGTNSCTAAPDAGVDQIENYMDYTDDMCMNIFTYDQRMRMRVVLESSPRRSLLLTSDACVPPNNNDASIVNILNPQGDNCAGSITPTVVIRNRGGNNLTSANVSYTIDNGAPTNFAWTGNLTPGSSANVILPAFSTPLGMHLFKAYTTLPNGLADPSPGLDTSSVEFVVSNGTEAPFLEDFENGTFPPDIRWVVNNLNNDCYRWLGASATSITGVLDNAAAQFPGFGNNTGGTEELVTPIFVLPCNATSANLQFDVAYRRRNNTLANYERLYIEISENCGTTWNTTPIYDKTGTVLQTVTTTQTTAFIPTTADQWRTETIDLLPFVTSTSKSVKFRIRAVAANGNNIYIDNLRFNTVSSAEINVAVASVQVLDEGYYNMGSVTAGTPLAATFTVSNSGSGNLILQEPITVAGTGFTLTNSFGATTVPAGGSTTFTITFNNPTGGNFTGNVSFGNNDCDEGTYNFILNATATVTPPNADFIGAPTTICAGSSVSFTNLSTNGISYLWNFGPGATPATSTDANPIVVFNTIGTNTITLTATNAFGSDVETKTAYITILDANGTALPISEGFVGATFVPVGWELVNLNASPTTWVRSTAAGNAPTAGNSMMFDNFTYNDADDDEVRMPGANFTGYSSVTLNFDVAYAPYSATFFDGLEVLVSSDCGNTYSSVYSKSNTILATAPLQTTAFTPTAAQWRTETVDLTPYIGNSKVIVAFRNLSGYGNRLFVDNINLSGVAATLPPTAGFTATPTTLCIGNTVSYTNTSTEATSYSWSFPGGTPATSTATNPIVTYSTPGIYDVTLVASNGVGSDTETLTNYITVNTPPVTPGAISGTATVCSGSTGNVYSITAVPGATSYAWTIPAGATITAGQGTTATTITMGASSGNISVTASNVCGTSTASTLAVTVNSAPATPGSISGTSTVCSGSSGNVYSITAVPGATSYTWIVPAGAVISSGQGTTAATVTFGSTSGNVLVSATNSCGTSANAILGVTVTPTPVISLGATSNPSACGVNDGSVTINGSGSGVLSWTGAASGSTGSISLPFVVNSLGAGAYSFSFSNGCSSNSIIASLVDPSAPSAPTVSVVNECGSSVLTAVGSNLTWSTGQTNASITVTASGTYSVTQTIAGCTSAAANITANPLVIPVISQGLLTNPSICATSDGSIQVNGTTFGTLTWTGPVSGGSSVSLPFTIGSLSAGVYTITFNNGCASNVLSVGLSDPSAPSAPSVSAVDGCGSSTLTASGSNLFWSTSETSATISVSTAGEYTVTQTVAGCTSLPASITAAPQEAPVITLGMVTDPSSCSSMDGTITVNGSGTGTVSWTGAMNGSVSAVSLPYTITGLAAGGYTITFENLCLSNLLSATIVGGSLPLAPTVTVENNCGFTVLTASGTGLQWSTSETSNSITVTSSNPIYVSQTVGGCTGPVTTVNPAPLTVPSVTFTPLADVCINSPIFTLTQGSPAGGTYSGPGVNGTEFDPELAGYGTFLIYYEYTAVNGCSGIAHQPITVGCADLTTEGEITMSIYPNPTNGSVNVTVQNDRLTEVRIFDQTGRIIYEDKLDAEFFEFDLIQNGEGVYTILITTLNGQFVERIVYIK
jgi:PKD repeat protein